jgi:hypothetical protein
MQYGPATLPTLSEHPASDRYNGFEAALYCITRCSIADSKAPNMKISSLLFLALLQQFSLTGQMLIVDRGIGKAAETNGGGAIRVGSTQSSGFVGDHFKLGVPGEIWVMDTIRIWAMPENDSPHLGDRFDKLLLFGAIESPPTEPGQPYCDCHNLITIRNAKLRPGTDEREGSNLSVSHAGTGAWQVDFRDLRWSVPGGVEIQFGVKGVGRSDRGGKPLAWYNRADRVNSDHQLRVFDENGKLEGRYMLNGSAPDPHIGLNVQVWAHKTAPIMIRSVGNVIEVVLQNAAYFNARNAKVESLRFGPKKAVAIASRTELTGGQPELVIQFRRTETGIRSAEVTACLTGLQLDGVPFEGCDLLKK